MGHLRSADYLIADAPLHVAQRLVAEHHYAHGGSNTSTFLHGLYRRDFPMGCLGVAWWIPPTKAAAIASWDGDWQRVLSLSRLVIVPDMPTNAASFLLGASMRHIARDGRYRCLVTYADEWQGHTGAIYRATNWEYVGLTAPEPIWINEHTGRMVARKAGPRTRTQSEMSELGMVKIGAFRRHKFRMILPEIRLRRAVVMQQSLL